MGEADSEQLSRLVDGDSPAAVIAEVDGIFGRWFGASAWAPVNAAAVDIMDVFAGRFSGYHACDTDYHDIRHTMAVLLACARLADGRFLERGAFPELLARDLLIAAICHDTGYIRRLDEPGGTGARFTVVHVGRSIEFVRVAGGRWGLDQDSVDSVSRLIWATGLQNDFDGQEWASPEEEEAGALLASADLVGQMADRAYLEKLLFLYYELKEAGMSGYNTEFDILRKTMGFYELTLGRLDGCLGGVRSLARRHFAERWGVDSDLYAVSMQRQMDYLKTILDDETTNFRRKLKRMDMELSQPRTA